MMEHIGKSGINQHRPPVSIWRVCIPSDVDRDEYIRTCYLTGTVSIVNENVEAKHKVKVGVLAMQQISFPKDYESFGSEVICATAPYSGKLYVIDVYAGSEEFSDQDENQYRLYKHDGLEGYAEVRIDGQGRLLLSVDSETVSDITISATNKNKDAQINVSVNGDVKISASNKITIDSPEINLNEEGEPVLLGDKTVELLSSLLDQLAIETAGPYSLLGTQVYTDLKGSIEELKSKLSFVK